MALPHLPSLAALVLFYVALWPVAQVEELFLPVLRATEGTLADPDHLLSQRVASLEGEWAFFPGVLAEPTALVVDPPAKGPRLVPVPWPLKHNPATGDYDGTVVQGTYRLRLTGLTPGVTYGLFVKEVASAYRLFFDGELVASRGELFADSYRAEVGPRTALFTAHGTTGDLVLQIADRTSSLGGLWQRVYAGPAQAVLDLHARVVQRDLFFLASLVMMALFQWIMALVIRRDRATAFLAAFCTAIVVKSAFSETMLGFAWFPNLPYEGGMLLAYLALVVLIPFFLAYTHHCFPAESWARLVTLSWIPPVIQACLVFLTPFEWYQDHFLWFQIYLVAGCVLVLVIAGRAAFHGREGAVLFIVGFLLVFAAGINDILYSLRLVPTGYQLNIGLYSFLLVQTALVAQRYRAALLGMEELSRNLEGKVKDRTRELAEERNTFERLSQEDSLTGLYNKRHLNAVLDTEFEAYQRYGAGFSVLMIDLDWFKRVNDTHGHLCGDRLLVELGGLLKANLRRTDLCARFGGEEFVAVMRHTRLEEARLAAENLRRLVEAHPFEVDGLRLSMTISIGVAEVSADTPSEAALIRKADEALYLAKSTGRNRVVTA